MIRNYIRPEIQAMGGYIPGEQPKGQESIKLNTNENPYRSSEKVYEAICRTAEKGVSRYPNAMGQAFREVAAQLYHVEPDWILCGNGSDDILTILTRAFVGSGQLLRLPYPSYILYRSLAELQGAESEEIRFNSDWTLPECFGQVPKEISPSRVHSIRSKDLKLVYLPNPNSPSGTLLSNAEIARIAEQLPCPLVIDEAYADFAQVNCIELVKSNPKIIISRTLSKSYALAGLRFGFMIAQPELINELIKVKDSYNCDSIAIAAATAALEDQEWLIENRRKILATRERLFCSMKDLGFNVPESHSNFTWNVHSDKSISPLHIYNYLKDHGYLVRYMNYDQWGDGLRISVGTDEQIDACLDLIRKCL